VPEVLAVEVVGLVEIKLMRVDIGDSDRTGSVGRDANDLLEIGEEHGASVVDHNADARMREGRPGGTYRKDEEAGHARLVHGRRLLAPVGAGAFFFDQK